MDWDDLPQYAHRKNAGVRVYPESAGKQVEAHRKMDAPPGAGRRLRLVGGAAPQFLTPSQHARQLDAADALNAGVRNFPEKRRLEGRPGGPRVKAEDGPPGERARPPGGDVGHADADATPPWLLNQQRAAAIAAAAREKRISDASEKATRLSKRSKKVVAADTGIQPGPSRPANETAGGGDDADEVEFVREIPWDERDKELRRRAIDVEAGDVFVVGSTCTYTDPAGGEQSTVTIAKVYKVPVYEIKF